MNKVNALVKQLKEQGLRIALAESMSCGMASSMIASYKGASEVLAGSVVCYTPEVKAGLLGVSNRLIEACSCESPEVTEAMCKGLKKLIRADIYVAVTGLASEGGSETKDKPVGTVFYHMISGRRSRAYRMLFRGTPLTVRKKACINLYELVLKHVRNE